MTKVAQFAFITTGKFFYKVADLSKKRAISVIDKINHVLRLKELLNNLGIAYLATKENEKSKSMFEQARKNDPSNKPALDNLKNLEKID